jgi:DNA helicase II / ATP-dependent DNA helicase PcrA
MSNLLGPDESGPAPPGSGRNSWRPGGPLCNVRFMPREYALKPFRHAVDLRIDYAKELNEQQLAAVTAPPGPALVIAGAGAGKTRTLIYRVAFLLEQGIPADRMLLLTFTNKAAREMMRRASELLGSDLSELWGGTFHSIGHRLLRRHAERLGYTRDFSILDREDAADLVQACVDDAEVKIQETRFPKKDVLLDIFSRAANTDRSIAQVLGEQYDYFSGLTAVITGLQDRYTARKQQTRAMDFDDLLVLWRRLLLEHAEVRDELQHRFQFVLVDEYQDTNRLQAEIIDLLAARHQHVMAVGDDAQSIYSWRGANFRNILEFPKRYPAARVFKIETNYRSTPEILALANAAIAANTEQFEKELAAIREAGVQPALVVTDDGAEQAAFVAQRVLELRDEGIPLDRIAVLYRAHFHALELQLELTRRNIPFSITSGIRFFEQAHIKDVAAHLRLVTNPRDELAFKRVVRLLPGVGSKGGDRLWKLFADAVNPPAVPVARAMERCQHGVPKKAATSWAGLSATLAQLDNPELQASPARGIEWVLEAGYQDYLRSQYANYSHRLEDLEQLAVFARQFASTEEFLAQLALLTNIDTEQPDRTRDQEHLKLSSVHQAKGLEFDVVFVIMLCEGLFPSQRSLETQAAEEEERRLFYVAVTRARNELYLSYPRTRDQYGRGGDYHQRPSRFLSEIPADLREEWNLRG